MLKFRFVVCVILTMALSVGCAKKSGEGSAGLSSVSFSLPANFGNGALSGTACFAVNIKANDIPSTSAGQCDGQYGVFAGLAKLGGVLQLKAPRGKSRVIEIFYVVSENGCPTLDPGKGIGAVYGSNNVYRVSTVSANFDKTVVEVVAPIEYPTTSNSLKSLLQTPAVCDKAAILIASPPVQARPILGEYRGTTDTGSPVHVRVTDKQIEFESSPSAPGQLRPIRLGVNQ